MKPTILCVDDDASVRASLKEQLRRSLTIAARVETADSGEAALAIVRELLETDAEIPLVISDQIMPGMRGDELLVALGAELPETRLILLTGQAPPEALERVRAQASFHRHIGKPWQRDELCAVVEEALRAYLTRAAPTDE